MTNLTLDNITEIAIDRLGTDASPRLKEIMTHLIRHIHALVVEVGLTPRMV